MAERIQHHQARRDESHCKWQTLELPREIDAQIEQFTSKDTVLLDCLTNLVSNELFAGWEEGRLLWQEDSFRTKVYEQIFSAIKALESRCANVIVVSNELFSDIPVQQDGTIYFLKLLGQLHQSIVNLAEKAILVENGIPIVKKGENL